MDKEEIKAKCNINNIQEITFLDKFGEEIKMDYIIDNNGNAIINIKPLHYVLIEKIKELEARVLALEEG